MSRKFTTGLVIVSALATSACQEHLADPVEAQDLSPAAVQQERMAGPGGGYVGFILANADEIELTAEQRSRIEAMNARLEEQSTEVFARIREELGTDAQGHAAFRNATPEQREAIRPLMEELREAHRAAMEEVGSVLTDAQHDELRGLRPERGERRLRTGDRPGGPGPFARGDGPGGRFGGVAALALEHADEIELTAGQRTQLEALMTEMRQEMESMRASGERPTREQMEARFTAHRERIESILTPPQIAELRSLRPERRDGGGRRGPRGGGI